MKDSPTWKHQDFKVVRSEYVVKKIIIILESRKTSKEKCPKQLTQNQLGKSRIGSEVRALMDV